MRWVALTYHRVKVRIVFPSIYHRLETRKVVSIYHRVEVTELFSFQRIIRLKTRTFLFNPSSHGEKQFVFNLSCLTAGDGCSLSGRKHRLETRLSQRGWGTKKNKTEQSRMQKTPSPVYHGGVHIFLKKLTKVCWFYCTLKKLEYDPKIPKAEGAFQYPIRMPPA